MSKSVTHRTIWSVRNFTRENFDRIQDIKKSEKFTIYLDKNKTQWSFWLYPRSRIAAEYVAFYLLKNHFDSKDLLVKFDLYIQSSDTKLKFLDSFERKSSDFKFSVGWPKIIKTDDIFNVENKYLVDNCLTFVADLEFFNEEFDDKIEDGFALSLAEHFNSKRFSDFAFISSDGIEIPVHRCIVSSRSNVLDKMFGAEMMENKIKQVNIDDLDGETLMEMLRFIYTEKVENLDMLASSLLYAAEKYNLPQLKSMCVKSLIKTLSLDNVIEILILADQYNEEVLIEKCIKLIKINLDDLQTKDEWKKLRHELLMKVIGSLKHVNTIPLDSTL